MKVLVYGGAFDPLHNMHLGIAEDASHMYDEVWLTPCFNSPYGKDMLPFNKRCDMLYAALRALKQPKLKVCQAEKYYPNLGDGYTLDLMDTLKENNPGVHFSVLMGMDSANKIHKWKNSQRLIHTNRFVVCRRGNEPVPSWLTPGEIFQVQGGYNLSSTDCRDLIEKENWDTLKTYIIPEVLEIIKENRHYGCRS